MKAITSSKKARHRYSDLKRTPLGPETESGWDRVWGARTKENWDAHVAREEHEKQAGRESWIKHAENMVALNKNKRERIKAGRNKTVMGEHDEDMVK